MSWLKKAWKKLTKGAGKVVDAVGDAVKTVGEAVVNTIKYVAENPEVAVIAIAAPQLLPSIGITGIAVQPVTAGLISASQGGDIEDIGKAALGSFVGQGVGIPVAKQAGVALGAEGNPLMTALANGVGGGVGSAAGAAATGGDVGQAAGLGAIGSASASLARSGATSLANVAPRSATAEIAADIGEAFGRTAISGDLSGELTGAAFNTLAREGDIAMQELRQPTTKTGADQVVEAFSQPKSAGVGKQIGSPLAEADTGTRTDVLPQLTVTAEPETQFDVRTGKKIPVVKPPAKPAEQMTGKELIEQAAKPEEREALPAVEVTGEGEEDVRTRQGQVAEEPVNLAELSDQELIDYLNQEFPLTPVEAEAGFKPLDVSIAAAPRRRTATPMSVSARAVGTSPTAAIVGQKEPVFGGEEDAQQDVWNTRSLRLRKALG